jgi:hypothetical protein
MSAPEEADRWFERYAVGDLVRISNPDRTLYRQFGLDEGSLFQLAHPRVWIQWFRTAILDRRGVGTAGPNWRQLTGVFVVRSGQILAAVRHANSAARPNYVDLAQHARSRVPDGDT